MIEQFQRRIWWFEQGIALAGALLMLGACGQSGATQVNPTPDRQLRNTLTSVPVVEQTTLLASAPPATTAAPPQTAESPVVSTALPLASRFADDASQATRTPLPAPAGTCPGGCESPPAGCVIKGTIPSPDYRVYLLPGQPGYDRAQIDAHKGERWFCTIDEARAAGWMPSKGQLPAGHAP